MDHRILGPEEPDINFQIEAHLLLMSKSWNLNMKLT